MTKISLDWVADTFSRFDILDLHITLSDLVDIPLTDDDLVEQAYFDTMALRSSEGVDYSAYQDVPLGKLVL